MIQKEQNSAIKIIFICCGNACRSPIAEILCNSYGNGKVVAKSAGVHPALPYIDVDESTITVMEEIGFDISCHKPRHVRSIDPFLFDVLINMSPLATQDFLRDFESFKGKIIEWDVVDPRGKPKKIYREVRDDLKQKVLDLIKNLTGR